MKADKHKRKNRLQEKRIITTDLFNLIDAVQSEVNEDEEDLIPQAVLGILNHNKIRFLNKQNRKTNH